MGVNKLVRGKEYHPGISGYQWIRYSRFSAHSMHHTQATHAQSIVDISNEISLSWKKKLCYVSQYKVVERFASLRNHLLEEEKRHVEGKSTRK